MRQPGYTNQMMFVDIVLLIVLFAILGMLVA